MFRKRSEKLKSEQPKKKGRIRKAKKKPFYKRFWFWLFFILFISGGVGSKIVWDKYGQQVQESVNYGYQVADSLDANSLRSDKPTIIYDYQGNEIKKLNTAAEYQIKTEDFNPILFKGFPATEDERFSQHHGVDPWALLRAIGTYIKGGDLQGGSTITQQLVKNKILKNSAQTVNRKTSEMVIAQELEKKFSKDEILTSYLNYVYFGHGANGVGMAAKYYFNKDQKDLSVREVAVIIGLTNNPTLYDPVNNPEGSDKKVEQVLFKLYRNKVINEEQYQQALNDKTTLSIGKLSNQKEYTDNYAISYAMNRAAENLAVADGFQLKYKFETDDEFNTYHESYNSIMQEKLDQLTSGGYNIYTSINMDLQKDLENKIYSQLAPYSDINPQTEKYDLQTSATIIDNQTHNVVAIVGGRGTENDYLNRGYQLFRQPGSTSKPIIAYAPAFETGNLLPQSIMTDTQVPQYPTVNNARNIYSGTSYTVREAVNWSLNTTAIKASLMTDINKVTDKLAAMEFHSLHPYDNNNIIAIGGFTYGATTTEMAAAYSSFANKGVFYQPSNVEKITSAYDDAVLYQNPHNGKKVYSKEASYAMLDVLKTAGNGYTVTEARALSDNYPRNYQAGKTGTTDLYHDVYFASINHYYSVAVWVGADQPRTLGQEEQKEAKRISRIINDTLLTGKTPIDFEKPDSVNKNGDEITFSSQETVNNETSVTATKFLADAKAKENKSKEENHNRVANLDYRVYYGLSLEDEESRESVASDLISKVDTSTFNSVDQYESFQKKLAEIDTQIGQVKRSSKKKEFSDKLSELRTEVSDKYSELLNRQAEQERESLKQKIDKARSEADSENSVKISELEAKIVTLKEKITNANKTNQSTSDLMKELDETINTLNSLGKPTPYLRIWTDGKKTLFVETTKPTLTQN